MDLISTESFMKDTTLLDKPTKEVLRKKLLKIKENPEMSKPIGNNRFSERFEGYRIVFEIYSGKIYLLRVKKRDEVYRNI